MAKNNLKLFTMAAENFEIYLSQMAKKNLKLSIMDGGNLGIYCLQ